MEKLYGGIEAGGTKFVNTIANAKGEILMMKTISTTSAEATLDLVSQFFVEGTRQFSSQLIALGIGNFGPLDLNLSSKTYGSFTSTTKPDWKNIPIKAIFRKKCKFSP